MYAIVNTKLLLEDSVVWDGAVTFTDGRILEAGPRHTVSIPEGATLVDAGGLYTAPGLIDIHNHGSDRFLFGENPQACAEHFLRHGETTVLPTFYCNMTAEQMLDAAARIRADALAGRVCDGFYLEGPYMSGEGSNQNTILWNGEIRQEEYAPLVDRLGDAARVWAIDPARPGIGGFMAYVRQRNPGAIFALGHSHATAAQCRAVQHYGVKVQTHHNDSGKAPGRAQGTMGAGCDEYTLANPDLYAELICDEQGIHVDPDLIRMVIRTKGVERIVLITDSMATAVDPATGEPYRNNEAEGILYGPDLNYDYEGHLAGSHLTLDAACRNAMAHSGYGLCHVIRMATRNPAQLLGIDDQVGSLAPGKRANLIVIDDMVHVKKVFLDGQLACEDGQLRL